MGSPFPRGPIEPGRTGDLAASPTPVWIYTPPPPQNAWQRWGRNLVLFLLTVASVFLTAALLVIPGEQTILALDVGAGLRLAGGLLGSLFK